MMRLVEAKDRADYSARAMTRAMTRTMTRTVMPGLLAGAFFVSAAAAQTEMYPGQGIAVNPAAINGHGYISPYGRSPYPDILHLHMPAPVHHHHVATKAKPVDVATAAPADTTPPAPAPAAPAPAAGSPFPAPLDSLTDMSSPPAPVKHKHHAHVTEAAAPASAPPAAEESTGQDAGLPLTLDPQAEHPVAQAPKHKRAQAGAPVKTASIDSDANAGAQSGLSMRSQILFPRGDPDVSSTNVDKMRAVAADLTSLLGAGAQRVELDAYGGTPGDKGSDARRLSLKRALGIRQLLIEDGVPPEKIDVRAMGGIDDSGAPDRVDVLVRGG
jgi:outer membrane protein OmpA-like peptidoglycan-associated protein